MGNLLIRKLNATIKANKVKITKGLVIFLIAFICFFTYIIAINPVLLSTIEYNMNLIATRAINKSIANVVEGVFIYDDFVNIILDDFGNISMIQAKSMEINNLSNALVVETEKNIELVGKSGVNIPMGSFTGVPILGNVGPKIKFVFEPIGAVKCDFSSNFDNAGINQTRHKLYVNIKANLGVVLPFYNKNFSTEQKILICENIIVGQVPEVYLYSDNLDTLLNFVPY